MMTGPDAAAEQPAEAEAAAAGPEVSPFAAGMLEKQPVRGYQLLSCLAADDWRGVFRADDRNMDRPAAVKIMRPYPGREGAVEEFFSLAGSIARLRCPGAARGLDAGRADGCFFLAYEFLPGESLAARLARRQSGCLTEKEALKFAGDTARVLLSLFEAGHPYGHLTPANVLLAQGGRVGLTDIGFAWTLAWPDDEAAFASQPDFLPPERIEGDLNVDVRGDLYSLGAILHLALTGRPVFQGETPAETLRMHREAAAPSLRDIDPRLSAQTAELVLWLLEKDRSRRPRTPKEFLRRLAAHPLAEQRGEGENEEDAAAAGGTDGCGTAAAENAPDAGAAPEQVTAGGAGAPDRGEAEEGSA